MAILFSYKGLEYEVVGDQWVFRIHEAETQNSPIIRTIVMNSTKVDEFQASIPPALI